MQITVKVQPNSSKREIVEVNHPMYNFKVYINSSPEKGKANAEVIEIISKHFGVSKSAIGIRSGLTSKIKTIEIAKEQP